MKFILLMAMPSWMKWPRSTLEINQISSRSTGSSSFGGSTVSERHAKRVALGDTIVSIEINQNVSHPCGVAWQQEVTDRVPPKKHPSPRPETLPIVMPMKKSVSHHHPRRSRRKIRLEQRVALLLSRIQPTTITIHLIPNRPTLSWIIPSLTLALNSQMCFRID